MDTQQAWPQGVFPARLIELLAQQGAINTSAAFDPDQVQPASLDLRLGAEAHRMRCSFLPDRESVRSKGGFYGMMADQVEPFQRRTSVPRAA